MNPFRRAFEDFLAKTGSAHQLERIAQTLLFNKARSRPVRAGRHANRPPRIWGLKGRHGGPAHMPSEPGPAPGLTSRMNRHGGALDERGWRP